MRKFRPTAFARMEKFAQQDLDENSMDFYNHRQPQVMPGGGYHPALPETAVNTLRGFGLFGQDIYKAILAGDPEQAKSVVERARYSLLVVEDVIEHMMATGGTEAEQPPPESVSGD
jgi:hypothetical protein